MQNEFGESPAGPSRLKYDPVADIPREDGYLTQEQPAIPGGGPKNQMAPDGERSEQEESYVPQPQRTAPLFKPTVQETQLFKPSSFIMVSEPYAAQRASLDAIILGTSENIESDKEAYKAGRETVQDYLIRELEARYTEEFIDKGVLTNIQDMPQEEQVARVLYEFNRHDSQKETSRVLLAINLLRAGQGSAPERALDEISTNLTPAQTEALFNQHREAQLAEMNKYIDHIAAQQGEGFTTAMAVGEIGLQDLTPFWGAITRVLGTRKFLPGDVEMSVLRQGLPGELRQEVREWWVNASHEERVNYLRGLQKTFDDIRKGPNSPLYTRYLIIENLMGTFTEDLLKNSDPNDSFDRIAGNLDTLLGAIVAVGTVAKRGTSIFDIFKVNKASLSRHAAEAAGNKKAVEALDENLRSAAGDIGATPTESAAIDLPRPKILEDDLDVLPDSVKDVVVTGSRIGRKVLEETDPLTGLGLTELDRSAKTIEFVQKLSNADGLHPMVRMTTVSDLPNENGIRVSVVYGKEPGEGWNDLGDLLEEIKEIDPYNLHKFEILGRGPDGKLVPLDITPSEMKAFFDEGRIPALLEQKLDPMSATTRLFGGKKLSAVSQQDLEDALRFTDAGSEDWVNIRRELNNRAMDEPTGDVLTMLDGEELYIRRTEERYWGVEDKVDLNGTFAHSWVPTWARVLLPQNSKFRNLYEAFRKAYHTEASIQGKMSLLYKPFDDLPTVSKQNVQKVLMWAEDEAKAAFEATGVAKAPTFSQLLSEFPDLTEAELRGYAAVRTGLDIQYEVFNRRLYRDFHNRGLVTIRHNGNGPNYHGTPMGDRAKAGQYYDPDTREVVTLSREEVAAIRSEGGEFLELDFAIDVPSGGQFTRLVARKGKYDVGPLSRSPLNYYEGYSMRFYSDPIAIKKITRNAKVNGEVTGEMRVEVIRMAGSTPEARRFLDKFRTRPKNDVGEFLDKDDPNVSYRIDPVKSMEHTEGTLYQNEALYREGRLFWDTRAMQRLPDVNGNDAKVWDTAHSLHKGTAMAMRQTTQEDLLRTFKNAFKNEFQDLPIFVDKPLALEMDELRQIKAKLIQGRRTATDPDLKLRYNRALEVIAYMRTQMGTDTFLVPALRERMFQFADWLGVKGRGYLDPVARYAQRMALSADPFAFARRVSFNAFMVLRPFRQALLQSMQVSMLMGLDPKYIGSGKIFMDALALRRGIGQLRKSGYSDGWSDASVAGAMGLSKREYKRLVEEFDRAGLLESVDTHSFNANAGRARNARLDSQAGVVGRGMYNTRLMGRRVVDVLQRGFEWGEQNNLTFSWLLAVKRAKTRLGVEDITKIGREDWTKIAADADALALAMTRPNKMAYQSGGFGVMLQFLSFQHRALVTMLGLNPSIKGKEARVMLAAMYTMWGGNILGMEDGVRDALAQIGISGDAEKEIIPGTNQTLADILSAGAIETAFNAIASASGGTELDLGTLAPGANVWDIYTNFYDGIVEKPIGMALLGPTSSQVSGFVAGMRFLEAVGDNEYMSAGEKFLGAAEMYMREGLPGLNDANKTWVGYQLGLLVDKDGDSLGIKPTVDALIARGLFGFRPEEETAIYRMRKDHWESQDNIDNMVDTIKPALKLLAQKWRTGEDDYEHILEQARTVWSFVEDAPEGVRQIIYERAMSEPDLSGESVNALIAKVAKEGMIDVRALIPGVWEQNSWTYEQKKQTVQLIEDIAKGYEDMDRNYEALLEPELK